jgi:hypothetical protein
MEDRLIGSLIYGDHPEPRKARPWKQRLKAPVAITLILVVGGGLLYTFINFREEARVRSFLAAIAEERYEDAFAMWDAGPSYTFDRFLEDWGSEAYYTTGTTLEVVDSESSGGGVIVYVSIDESDPVPTAIRVDKETRLLSYSPTNKYQPVQIFAPRP